MNFRMNLRWIAGGFALGVLAATTALTTTHALSQQETTSLDMQAAMEDWIETMTPGPQHDALMKTAGEWETTTRFWMAGPDAPPTESTGKATFEEVLDGRFLLQRLTFSVPMPDMDTGELTMSEVQGMGLFGYDNYRKLYVGCWADTMGTQLLHMTGAMSPDGKTMTMYGEMDEPMLGVIGRMVKYVTRTESDDRQVFQVYDLHAGDDYKVVEVIYERVK